MSSIINFLGSLRTGKGHLVSYGSYRMFKATVVNTLTLTRQIAESPADQILLEQLSTTIQRTNPDGAKYAECFDLDDLINRRIELYDKQPYSAMSRDVSAHRLIQCPSKACTGLMTVSKCRGALRTTRSKTPPWALTGAHSLSLKTARFVQSGSTSASPPRRRRVSLKSEFHSVPLNLLSAQCWPYTPT